MTKGSQCYTCGYLKKMKLCNISTVITYSLKVMSSCVFNIMLKRNNPRGYNFVVITMTNLLQSRNIEYAVISNDLILECPARFDDLIVIEVNEK